jgi:hypothetical protein
MAGGVIDWLGKPLAGTDLNECGRCLAARHDELETAELGRAEEVAVSGLAGAA